MTVRNEEWILRQHLQALSNICDQIFLIDHASTDSTEAIARSFSRVRYVRTDGVETPGEGSRQALALAREAFAGAVMILLDADEILSAQALESPFRARLEALEPGTILELPWITLWKHPRRYRDDSSRWSDLWTQRIFRDDGRADYAPLDRLHEPRLPRLRGPIERLPDIKILHYQMVAHGRSVSKHAHYKIWHYLFEPPVPPAEINEMYSFVRDERNMRLTEVPDDWVRGWLERGLDLDRIEAQPLSWFDVDVLRYFASYGVERFADLDIWDVDWEKKRIDALATGIGGLPPVPVRDPRNLEQRLHHEFVKRFFVAPFWRAPQVLGRPARRLLKRIGLTRDRLGLSRITSQLRW